VKEHQSPVNQVGRADDQPAISRDVSDHEVKKVGYNSKNDPDFTDESRSSSNSRVVLNSVSPDKVLERPSSTAQIRDNTNINSKDKVRRNSLSGADDSSKRHHQPTKEVSRTNNKVNDHSNDAYIQLTVNLMTTHKMAIAEMVEVIFKNSFGNFPLKSFQVMKEEMHLVQEMEDADDRDSEGYVDKLEQLLTLKLESISALRHELNGFQTYRQMMIDDVKRASEVEDDGTVIKQAKSLRRQSSGSISNIKPKK
jgi:hypothetical protein